MAPPTGRAGRRWLRAAAALAILAGYAAAAVLVLVPRIAPAVAAAAPQPNPSLPIAPPLIASVTAPPFAADSAVAPVPADSARLEQLAVRRFAHGPLARVLRRRAGGALADSIAAALIREAARVRVAPSLLAAVLLTENPRLNADTVNAFGATGLMQVMPFHAGAYGCASSDLLAIDGNICHGARIFAHYLKRTGNVRTALLRYNGCVRSTNTPRCERYPAKVLRLAGQVRHQLLAYAATESTTAARRDRRAALAQPADVPVSPLTSPLQSGR